MSNNILLGKKELKDPKKLVERRAYLRSLLAEGRPNASPSSQEWVSDEYYQGHRSLLLAEVAEIDALLKRMKHATRSPRN